MEDAAQDRAGSGDTTSGTGTSSAPGSVRPALDVPPLAAWWVVAAGIVVAMLFVLTDHMLRATVACAGSLLLAAALRLTLTRPRAGGIVVRGPLVDAATLVLLAVAILVSGFTLDLTAR